MHRSMLGGALGCGILLFPPNVFCHMYREKQRCLVFSWLAEVQAYTSVE